MSQMADYEDDYTFKAQITIALQDLVECIILDVMSDDKSTPREDQKRDQVSQKYNKRQRFKKINTSDIKSKFWIEKALKHITFKISF